MLDDVASLPLLSQGATVGSGPLPSPQLRAHTPSGAPEFDVGVGSRFELLEAVEGRGGSANNNKE